jgi:SSS family solute:Na+ symporter
MTTLLMVVLGALAAYAIHIATACARARPLDEADGGGTLPAWTFIFAGAGVVLGGIGLDNHLLLTARFGLQYNHVAVGLVLVALTGALVHTRTWLAVRITGIASPADLLGTYYGSPTIRIFVLVLVALFAVPFSATALAQTGILVEAATDGALPRPLVIFATAFFVFLYAVLGGWRAIVYVIGGQSLLLFVLLPFLGIFADATDVVGIGGLVRTEAGFLADAIPGVIQFSAGVGQGAPVGGIWTTTAILSSGIALIGLVLSPAFGFLVGTTARTRIGFAFNQVWMIAGLLAGLLLLFGPAFAMGLAAEGVSSLGGFARRLADVDLLAGVALVVMLVASTQICVAFFAGAGAHIVARDLVARDLFPDLTPASLRLAARIVLAVIFLLVALSATFTPLPAVLLGSLAIPLSVQLLPAYLGMCWLPWVSRSAVLAGLIVGTLIVLFTEPPGLIVFGGLFVELPWGRWPLTIHSAGWGLFFNLAACLLVSIFTHRGAESDRRRLLHDEFGERHPVSFGGRAVSGAKWSLTLIWTFLALGPGAILGNTFFSSPIFSSEQAELGVPSLWVWQILFWFFGVFLVWWLAYPGRLSVINEADTRRVPLAPDRNPYDVGRRPAWITQMLARVSAR